MCEHYYCIMLCILIVSIELFQTFIAFYHCINLHFASFESITVIKGRAKKKYQKN